MNYTFEAPDQCCLALGLAETDGATEHIQLVRTLALNGFSRFAPVLRLEPFPSLLPGKRTAIRQPNAFHFPGVTIVMTLRWWNLVVVRRQLQVDHHVIGFKNLSRSV